MRLIYLHPPLPSRGSLGQAKRREGLLRGLRVSGLEPHAQEVPESIPWAPRVLRYLFSTIPHLPRRADATILVEGLPLGLRAMSLAPRRKVIVDVCDSWLMLAAIDPQPGRAKLIACSRLWLKRTLAAMVLMVVSRRAKALIYISRRDADRDRRWIDPDCVVGVVANGVDSSLARAVDAFDRRGPILLLGDWEYPPNQDMLKRALGWASQEASWQRRGLRVVGPGWEEADAPRYVTYMPWVEQLADVFAGCACLLAPLAYGAGAKNKVVESICSGLPVLGSEEAFAGVPAELLVAATRLSHESEGPPNLEAVLSSRDLDARRRQARAAAASLTWEQVVGAHLRGYL